MYYLVYGFFYLLSLIPWWVMYLISDGIYFLLYHVFGYRKNVVRKNLAIAFPEKTASERLVIEKDFYKNFTDTFLEIIKLVSISRKELDKRFVINAEVLNNLLPSGQSVQLHSGHFFNWEFLNIGVSANSQYPFIGIFSALSNKVFNRLIITIRSRFGSILISTNDFRTMFHQYTDKPYALGLIADQNPVDPSQAYWVKFFDRLTPFLKGPEKGAKSRNAAVVMVDLYRVKRGYYRSEFTLLTTTPKATPKGYITAKLVHFIEESVRKRPHNYLWSHRRWKFEYDDNKFRDMVIDDTD